jgi:hypothetical protein
MSRALYARSGLLLRMPPHVIGYERAYREDSEIALASELQCGARQLPSQAMSRQPGGHLCVLKNEFVGRLPVCEECNFSVNLRLEPVLLRIIRHFDGSGMGIAAHGP